MRRLLTSLLILTLLAGGTISPRAWGGNCCSAPAAGQTSAPDDVASCCCGSVAGAKSCCSAGTCQVNAGPTDADETVDQSPDQEPATGCPCAPASCGCHAALPVATLSSQFSLTQPTGVEVLSVLDFSLRSRSDGPQAPPPKSQA